MMFNIPAATITYHLPRKQVLREDGKVLTQPYLFELASISMKLQDLDDTTAQGESQADIYDKVLKLDRELRTLASLTPQTWWNRDVGLSPDAIVQYIHNYLMVRVHVQSAMSTDEYDRYGYSRMSCRTACENTVRRYAILRRLLPAGYFLCRGFDMMSFTASIYLLLNTNDTEHREDTPQQRRNEGPIALVLQLAETLEAVSDQHGADFAREAATTIRSLDTLMNSPAPAHSHSLTLKIPLVGKINIRRRGTIPTPVSLDGEQAQVASGEGIHSVSDRTPNNPGGQTMEDLSAPLPDADLSATLPWLLELDTSSSLEDPFVMDDFYLDQWLDTNSAMLDI